MKTKLHTYITDRVPMAISGEQVGKVLEKIKSNSYDYLQHILIIDHQGKLKGCVELGNLLKYDPRSDINELLTTVHGIHSDKSLEYAVNHAISERMPFVPVTNKEGGLIGILPPQTIIETLRNEHIEDMHKIAGIRKEVSVASQAIMEAPIMSVWHRMPWLLVGLIGSFIATFIMSTHENTLKSNISLAFFIPGIVYLADAIGTQTETIVIRGLSLSWTSFKKILAREFMTGWLVGLILGLLSLLAALLGGFELQICLAVGISIMVAGTLATTIGLLLPWTLQRFGKDPAFGSGPLATVIQDILSILVYLLITKAMLNVL